jgi:hypothetical protein
MECGFSSSLFAFVNFTAYQFVSVTIGSIIEWSYYSLKASDVLLMDLGGQPLFSESQI